MRELNGFKIESYNQYNLNEGVKYSVCPLCSEHRKKKTEKCLTINWDNGLAKCHHCGEVVQLHTYKKKEQKTKVYTKPEFKNNTNLSDKLVKWFESRKISQFTLKSLKITEGMEWMPQRKKEVNTVQFNYFRENELINIKFRDGSKNFKMVKDAEKIPYNYDNCKASREIIITEGEIDTLSYFDAGLFNVCSIPNGSTEKSVNLEWLDNSYEIFENKEKIYLSIDNDSPGQNTQNELIRRLGSYRCYIIDLEDCKDANEYHVKYGAERLRECYENAELMPLENVTSYNDYHNELINWYANGDQRGYMIGLDNFDEVFSTYFEQFIVVTGEPRSGKSDWVDQMCLGYSLNYGWKGAFCSVENDPKFIHIDKLVRKLVGFRPNNVNSLSIDKWKKGTEFIQEHISFIEFKDGYDLRKVLDKAAEMVLRFGIKYLVLDPYNKIRLKESLNKGVNDYTNDYLVEIDNFVRKYNCLIIIVAHPIKRLKVNGKRPEIDFYDIKGGGEWFDMSPHGLLVHRDYLREIVKVKILKCKFQNLGQNEAECYYKWNSINGRYTPITNEVDGFTDHFNFDLNYESWLEKKDKKGEKEIENYQYNSNIEPDFEPIEYDDMPF